MSNLENSSEQNKANDNHQDASVMNVVSEFVSSLWTSGIKNPLESCGQLVGMQMPKDDSSSKNGIAPQSGEKHGANSDTQPTSGALGISATAGRIAGEIGAMVIVNAAVGKMLGIPTDAALGAEGFSASKLLLNSISGGIYGGMFTPTDKNHSRLDNILVYGGTFGTLGAASDKIRAMIDSGVLSPRTVALGDALAHRTLKVGAVVGDRGLVNAGAGAAAGLANTQLDAIAHNKYFGNSNDYLDNAVRWGAGNVLFGETHQQVSKMPPKINEKIDTVRSKN